MMEGLAAEMRGRREAGVPLDAEALAATIAGYVDGLRSRGWPQHVDPEQLDGVLDVVVVPEENGGDALDVESNVTDQSYLVPGWGVTETDPATVGRGLAEDDAELLDEARESGEATGWE